MSNKLYFILEGPYSSDVYNLIEFLDSRFGIEANTIKAEYLVDRRPLQVGKTITKQVFSDAVKKSLSISSISKDLEEFKPDTVIVFGNNACQYFFDKKASELKNTQTTIEIGGIKYNAYGFNALNYFKNSKDGYDHDDLLTGMKKVIFQSQGLVYEPTTKHEIISNLDRFDELIEYVKEQGIFCFDFETTGLDWYREDQVVTIISISIRHGYSYIVPLYHFESPFDSDDLEYIWDRIKEIFSDQSIRKIAHNLKFDLHWMARYGVTEYDGRFDDTMLMAHIIDENTPNGLKDVIKKYFPNFAGYETELEGYDWDKVPLELLSKYAAIDTDVTLRMCTLFENMLIEDKVDTRIIKKFGDDVPEYPGGIIDQTDLELLETKPYRLYLLYRNLVMPSFMMLFQAEHHGAQIDLDLIDKSLEKAKALLELKEKALLDYKEVKRFIKGKEKQLNELKLKEFEDKLEKQNAKSSNPTKLKEKYMAEIRAIKSGEKSFYEGFNFGSPTQLGELLYSSEGFGFPKMYDKRKREYVSTTSRDYLIEIDHPFIVGLFAYRSINNMINTFYTGIKERLDSNNKLHTSFLLHGTVTGRLSSRNPNLQNIPARLKFEDPDAEGVLKMVKKFFTSIGDEYVLLQADYSQAELRVIANFSDDDGFITAYQNDVDIHTLTASKILKLSLEQFSELEPKRKKQARTLAKGANFGLVYDISIEGYRQYLRTGYGVKVSEVEAKEQYDIFFQTYSKLKRWHKKYVDFATKYGYVRTLFGRKRRLQHIQHSADITAKNADIRQAINAPIQGTSGEYAIFSAAVLRHRLPKDCIFFNTVHDSVFFYVPKSKLTQCVDIINKACEAPPIELYFGITSGKVSMKMDMEVSEKCWGDMVPLQEFFEKSQENNQ